MDKKESVAIKALKAIRDLCAYEYLKGKRKININKIADIANAGLLPDEPADTTACHGNKHEADTSTIWPSNFSSGGVIG